MNFSQSIFSFLESATKKSKEIINDINKTIDNTVFKDLNEENRKFLDEKKSKKENVEFPWDNNPDLLNKFKELSHNELNFLLGPPRDVEFPFDYENSDAVIAKLNLDDPHIMILYDEIVPLKISPGLFWKNYMYHISEFINQQTPPDQKIEKLPEIVIIQGKLEQNPDYETVDDEQSAHEVDIQYDGKNWKEEADSLLIEDDQI